MELIKIEGNTQKFSEEQLVEELEFILAERKVIKEASLLFGNEEEIELVGGVYD